MPRLLVAVGGLALLVACNSSKHLPTVEQDRFETFTSQIGNELVVPSNWTSQEDGSSWYVRSPDGHAVISVFTHTAEGSGSPHEYGNLIAKWALPEGESGWRDSNWSPISLKQGVAQRRELALDSGSSDSRWRVYVIHTGRMYHAIVLNASEPVMFLNGDFYESLVQSFKGIE